MKIKMQSIAFMLQVVLWVNAVFASDDFLRLIGMLNSLKKTLDCQQGRQLPLSKMAASFTKVILVTLILKETKKVTDKTAFYIASITKPMFALSTLLMEHKGDIKESTSMAEMFPKQVFPHIDADKVQLKHLISNTSGLENWPLFDALAFTGNHNSKQRHKLMVNTTNDEKVKLGQYKYTNLGFNIVSVWADDYYKQDWQQTIAELIYKPLGMTHTSSYMTDATKKGF